MPDFRTERMPSPEGGGRAAERLRGAWAAYARRAEKVAGPVLGPVVEPLAKRLALAQVESLIGFWMLWHLQGGFDGLQRMGMSRSAVYRRVASFRSVFGVHPDAYVFPGVGVDPAEYLRACLAGEIVPIGPLPAEAQLLKTPANT